MTRRWEPWLLELLVVLALGLVVVLFTSSLGSKTLSSASLRSSHSTLCRLCRVLQSKAAIWKCLPGFARG